MCEAVKRMKLFELEKASVSKTLDCSSELGWLPLDHLGNFIKKLASRSTLEIFSHSSLDD